MMLAGLWPHRYIYINIYIYIYIYICYLSCHTTLTPQEGESPERDITGAEALAVARRPDEASRERNPAAAGIERFFSLRCP